MSDRETPYQNNFDAHALPPECVISLSFERHLERPSSSVMRGPLQGATCIPMRLDLRDVLLVDRTHSNKKEGAVSLRTLGTSPSVKMIQFLSTVLPFSFSFIEEGRKAEVYDSVSDFARMLAQPFEALLMPKLVLDLLVAGKEEERKAVEAALQRTKLIVLPLSVQPPPPGRGFVHSLNDSFKRSPAHCSVYVEYEQEHALSLERKKTARVAVLARKYGLIIFSDDDRENPRLVPAEPVSFQPPRDPCSTAPRAQLFKRRAVPHTISSDEITADALWVSKGTAWSDLFSGGEDTIVWTAGLSTWKELADRGIWVTGSAEGLGDAEDTGLSLLFPNLRWLRLSHSGAETSSRYPLFPTYELLPVEEGPDLTPYTHFYWKSGSSFLEALRRFPQIRDRWHASGPGHTHDTIIATLGSSERVGIFLSESDFKAATELRPQSGELQDAYV